MATYFCRDCKCELLGGDYVYALNDEKLCMKCCEEIEKRFHEVFGIWISAGYGSFDFCISIGAVERLLEVMRPEPDNCRVVLDDDAVMELKNTGGI